MAKRLLLVFSPNGTWPDEFFPRGGERDFTFGRILAPLAPWRERLMVLKPHGHILPVDLPTEISGLEPAAEPEPSATAAPVTVELPEEGVDLKAHIAEVERRFIADALAMLMTRPSASANRMSSGISVFFIQIDRVASRG